VEKRKRGNRQKNGTGHRGGQYGSVGGKGITGLERIGHFARRMRQKKCIITSVNTGENGRSELEDRTEREGSVGSEKTILPEKKTLVRDQRNKKINSGRGYRLKRQNIRLPAILCDPGRIISRLNH